jgi:vancomycin resistance protein YoaR
LAQEAFVGPPLGVNDPPLPVAPTVREPQESTRAKVTRIGSRVVLGFALLLLAVAASLYWFRASYADEVYPGVHVGGVNLGGMSHGAAVGALSATAAEIEEKRAYFVYRDQHWAPTLRELGVTVNVEASVDQALAIGRETGARDRLSAVVSTARSETWLPLQLDISLDQLSVWASRVDRDLGIVPKNATLEIEKGQVIIDPEVDGTVVDRERLHAVLSNSLATVDAPLASLPVVPQTPSVYVDDYAEVKATIETALSSPVKVQYEGETWSIDPVEFGEFIVADIDPVKAGSEAISIEIDERGLANWLNDHLSDEVYRAPVNATVAWNGERVIALSESQDGVRLLPTTLATTLTDSFFGNHESVTLPVMLVPPKVDSRKLDALGITTKLAAASSSFAGSDYARETNIRVGAQAMNGTLVAPGEEFSFHHAVGRIGPELGYVEASIIDGAYIGSDFGGGICQVSTTVFRSALYAGLEITEWWPHRYRLGFYELDGWSPGLDASILQLAGDDPFAGGNFKFKNPSDSWILVESYVDGPRVFVVLYSADLGYTVSISDPVYGGVYPATGPVEHVNPGLAPGTVIQTDWAQQGMDVTYYRTVKGPDGATVREDKFYTYFHPRGNVYSVSPDMQGRSWG